MSSNRDREHPTPHGEDSAVARAWREASNEQPPSRLDAAIMDAARRSGEPEDPVVAALPVRPPARNRWRQWQPLAAAATVAGLAFALVQTLPRDGEMAPSIRLEAPAAPAALEHAAAPAGRVDAPPAESVPDVPHERRSLVPGPSVTKSPATVDAALSLHNQSAEGAASSPAAEVADDVTPAPAAARAAQAVATPDTDDRVARIEALHASGDLAGAAEALRALRAIDPDAVARLPESLSEWARTVD